jgi:hypothetical protein
VPLIRPNRRSNHALYQKFGKYNFSWFTFIFYQNLNPTNYVVYTNRATAFKKHKEFELMLADAKVALSFSQDYFKAHLRHGEASVELGKKQDTITMIDEGIVSL